MAARLFIMRHTTAEYSIKAADQDRILTDLGKKEAEDCGKFLSKYKIDKALVSHVKRASDTADIVFKNYGANTIKIEKVTELYKMHQISGLAMLDLISRQEKDDTHLFVLGHNPVMYKLCLWCANPDPKISPDYHQLEESLMPPGRIVIIDFDEMSSWKNIHEAQYQGRIVTIFTPSLQ